MRFQLGQTLTIEDPHFAVSGLAPAEGNTGLMKLEIALPTHPPTTVQLIFKRTAAEALSEGVRKSLDVMKGLPPKT